ncbi:response regulator transcription factor [Microbacterium sp. LjRoot45]|uniref:LuxR C-terminal-related transcriptional regulator n=1 Tax=Microbacterium sp. LjRoot45 TaxID=3342329 RepID=UPI003ECE4661
MSARIGLVDDHPWIVLGVTAIINAQPGMRVTGAAGSVTALLQFGSRFDVVLLDLQLADDSSPRDNVLALAASGAVVLAFTSGENAALVREAARAGVAGMLRKSEPPARIVRAIEVALAGETVATPDWAAALSGDRSFVDAQLTSREAEVLGRYASGQTADQVAAALFVSRDTVLDHLRRIRRRYSLVGRDAPTKVDLHRRAVEDGLVSPDA